MGVPFQIAVALALTAAVLLTARDAGANVADVVSGGDHTSVWQVSDVGLYLDGSLLKLPNVGDAVLAAIDTWTSADTRLPHVWPVIGAVDDLGYRAGERNRNTIRYAAGGEPLAHGALAITIVSSDGEQTTILDGDIVLNGVYRFDNNDQFPGQQGSKGDHGAYDLLDVLSHEFGHWFGLPDNFDDSTSIMYPYFDPSATRRRTLSDSDKQALDDLYAGSSAANQKSTSCDIGPRGSLHHSGGFVAFGILALALLRRSSISRVRSKRHETDSATRNGDFLKFAFC